MRFVSLPIKRGVERLNLGVKKLKSIESVSYFCKINFLQKEKTHLELHLIQYSHVSLHPNLDITKWQQTEHLQ